MSRLPRRWWPGTALLAACAVHVPAPSPTPPWSPDDVQLARESAQEELGRWRRERSEAWLEYVDPGEQAEHSRRLGLAQIEGGAPVAEIFLQGESVFERRFTEREGLGTGLLARPAPALSRVENAAGVGGPDALSCKQCHGRGGDDGHGELHQRALLDGDGAHPHSAKARLAPHLAGLGWVQLLAAEASSGIQEQAEQLRAIARNSGVPTSTVLRWATIDFGVITARPDGTLDTSKLTTIDGDLVVKPLGWKGTHATLRSFVREALPQHLGLELPVPNPPRPNPDTDNDGIGSELHEGQITSLVAYIALLDVPLLLLPRSPAGREAFARGAARFSEIGCASCHQPELPLKEARFVERTPGGSETGLVLDLEHDSQVQPKLEQFDYTLGRRVRLFSDLRRHDMGPQLAERTDRGVAPSVFLTRPLWGLGDRGNYFLHDGRARSIAEAIRLHGGEAAEAAGSFAALPIEEQRAIEVFLLSLRRQPQGRILP